MIRITPGSAYATFTRNITRLASDMADLNDQIGSGRRVRRPSDDPAAAAQAVRLNADLARLDQLDRARGAAEDRLKTTESTLAAVGDVLSQVRVLALQGASSQGADSRAAIADNLEGLFQDLVGLANTRDGVSYIFSGFATETQPFTQTGAFADTVPPASTLAVSYNGTSDTTQAEIAPNDYATVGWPGDGLFLGGGDPTKDLFQIVVRVRDAVLAGDTDAVNAELGPLDDAIDDISSARGALGTELRRAQDAETRLTERKADLKLRLDDTQGVDLVGTIAALQQRETAYQAALSAGAKSLGMSLLDFIG